jgi:hypothetical protein
MHQTRSQKVKKFFLATAAVIALASPALAEDYTESPVMAHTMFSQSDPKEVAKLSTDGRKNYAINVFNKTGAHDLDIKTHSVFAAMDFDSHAYLASIWCEVNQQYAVVFMSVSGADLKYTHEALDKLAGTWQGEHNKPDVTATAKKKKGHNI